ncbi:hypothetical protein X805_39420 [Sphaerotilus natans subsp. natans DSM 6575]|uniref:HTH lysR-type domain-containing protein n=1 Tax=Sphaerotilus natans subsp. natans DSM 6575 TaxID=1286631 RepID=A0A059KH02_9BURK|nr:LysR family transcriptional regulator [Sphaerotilus natans]KDB50479.1 hypothetical protein X805_39420 [Sphaerotilus natans subsp. natans DSM 6575]SIR02864.1 transcriptional regulator, LysR family [Sphaerotilus natans]
MPINELRALSTFARAVELGSIRQAAQAQGVTPQAASQAIAQLEQHLGVRLLHRTTRRLALTEEGQHFLERTRPALATLERALLSTREAKDEIAGPLRIVGPRSSFATLLVPLLDTFCRAHPGIQPDVQLDDGLGDWVRDRVDVGFRMGRSPDEGVVGRLLFPVQLVMVASPAYLARHGVPRTVEDLQQHRCSVFRHPSTGRTLPWFLPSGGEPETREMEMVPALATNDSELELQAVLAGQVIAQVASFAAAPLMRSGRMVPVLLDQVCAPIDLHVYYGSRTALPRRVRAFVDLAVEQLKDNPAYVLDTQELAALAMRCA